MSFENKNTLGLEKTRFCQFDEFENVHDITQEILVRGSSYIPNKIIFNQLCFHTPAYILLFVN